MTYLCGVLCSPPMNHTKAECVEHYGSTMAAMISQEFDQSTQWHKKCGAPSCLRSKFMVGIRLVVLLPLLGKVRLSMQIVDLPMLKHLPTPASGTIKFTNKQGQSTALHLQQRLIHCMYAHEDSNWKACFHMHIQHITAECHIHDR